MGVTWMPAFAGMTDVPHFGRVHNDVTPWHTSGRPSRVPRSSTWSVAGRAHPNPDPCAWFRITRCRWLGSQRATRSPISGRIASLVARYASLRDTLEKPLANRLTQILTDHSGDVVRWLGRFDRALAALAVHVPELRDVFIAAVEGAERIAPEILLALAELGEAPGDSIELAWEMLESNGSSAERWFG